MANATHCKCASQAAATSGFFDWRPARTGALCAPPRRAAALRRPAHRSPLGGQPACQSRRCHTACAARSCMAPAAGAGGPCDQQRLAVGGPAPPRPAPSALLHVTPADTHPPTTAPHQALQQRPQAIARPRPRRGSGAQQAAAAARALGLPSRQPCRAARRRTRPDWSGATRRISPTLWTPGPGAPRTERGADRRRAWLDCSGWGASAATLRPWRPTARRVAAKRGHSVRTRRRTRALDSCSGVRTPRRAAPSPVPHAATRASFTARCAAARLMTRWRTSCCGAVQRRVAGGTAAPQARREFRAQAIQCAHPR